MKDIAMSNLSPLERNGKAALDVLDAIRMVMAGSEYDATRIKVIGRLLELAPGADVNGTASVDLFLRAVREETSS